MLDCSLPLTLVWINILHIISKNVSVEKFLASKKKKVYISVEINFWRCWKEQFIKLSCCVLGVNYLYNCRFNIWYTFKCFPFVHKAESGKVSPTADCRNLLLCGAAHVREVNVLKCWGAPLLGISIWSVKIGVLKIVFTVSLHNLLNVNRVMFP